jgi:hypothetical protein
LLAQTKRLKKFFGYFFLFDFALANGCREADKKRGNRPPRRRKNAVSFLPSFFLCGYLAKGKSVTKGKLSFDTKTF